MAALGVGMNLFTEVLLLIVLRDLRFCEQKRRKKMTKEHSPSHWQRFGSVPNRKAAGLAIINF